MFQNKLSNKNDAISPTKDTTVNTLTTQPPPDIKQQETSRDKYDNDTSKRDDGILQYLPIDVLKSVHRTLRSQPTSVEGKIYFLKTFEKTLMSEIGKTLHTPGALSRREKLSSRIIAYSIYRQNLALPLLWHQVAK